MVFGGYADGMSVRGDICFANPLGLMNTMLLDEYSGFDVRVSQLMYAVKKWASSLNINDASQGSLSSYGKFFNVLAYPL